MTKFKLALRKLSMRPVPVPVQPGTAEGMHAEGQIIHSLFISRKY